MLNKLLLPLLFTTLIIGCKDDKEPPKEPPAEKFELQVIHASQDSPKVNVLADKKALIEKLDFQSASKRVELDSKSYSISVDGITPAGDVTVIGPADLSFAKDQLYTVIALGKTADIEPLILNQSNKKPANDKVTLQVVHAASNAPTVDIYLTAPGVDIANESPVTTLSFKDVLAETEVAAGDYQVRITANGSKDVAFDSGTVSLAGGKILNLVAVTNTSTGKSPVSLLAVNYEGAGTILSDQTPADLRVFHLSADAPAVDVVANDNFSSPLLSNVSFPDFSGFLSVPAATYNVKVVPTGTTTPAVINADVTLEKSKSYSVLAVNKLASIEPLILENDTRPVSTEAKLRIVHASPTAGLVDLYLVAPSTDISNVEPNFSGVDFKAETGYLSVAEGDYDVIVTAKGSKTPAIGPAAIKLSNGGIYTIIARDNNGGGTPLGVVLADDFTK